MKYEYFKVFIQKYIINLKIIKTSICYLHDLHTFTKLIIKCELLKNSGFPPRNWAKKGEKSDFSKKKVT